MGLLDGKVAVVTGGGRGIGRAHALALAAAGAAVLVNDVGLELRGGTGGLQPGSPRPEVAAAVVEEIVAAGGKAAADATNVANIEAAAGVVDHAISEFGDIDIVVNNAGTVHLATIFDVDDERFDAEFSTHVKGTIGTTRAAVTAMKAAGHGGRIINTIAGGFGGGRDLVLYSAAKVAVAAYTRSTALDGAALGITANAIAPLAVTRQSGDWFFRHGVIDPDDHKTIDHLGPHQNSPLVVFLASDLSAQVTGRLLGIKPVGYTPDSPIRVYEEYLTSTAGLSASSWTPERIAAELPNILA